MITILGYDENTYLSLQFKEFNNYCFRWHCKSTERNVCGWLQIGNRKAKQLIMDGLHS